LPIPWQKKREEMSEKISIPDGRSQNPEDYENFLRQGRMKSSWTLGVEKSKKGERLDIDDGLTWGSIGQVLGYLFGEEDKDFQEMLFKKMRDYYPNTVRGKNLKRKNAAKDG
jgi:hypothetical protein